MKRRRPGSGVGVSGVGVGVEVGVGVGVEVGVGVGIGMGVEVGVGVPVAVGAMVGRASTKSVGCGTTVAVGVGIAVGDGTRTGDPGGTGDPSGTKVIPGVKVGAGGMAEGLVVGVTGGAAGSGLSRVGPGTRVGVPVTGGVSGVGEADGVPDGLFSVRLASTGSVTVRPFVPIVRAKRLKVLTLAVTERLSTSMSVARAFHGWAGRWYFWTTNRDESASAESRSDSPMRKVMLTGLSKDAAALSSCQLAVISYTGEANRKPVGGGGFGPSIRWY